MKKRELLHTTLTRRFAPTSPDTGWHRDLSATHQKIGGALGAQGDAPRELAAYCTSLATSEALAASANAQWQHDVSVRQYMFGEVLEALGTRGGRHATMQS